MTTQLLTIFKSHKDIWFKRSFLLSISVSLFLFITSAVANFYAAVYATARASSPVADLILSNIPVFDVGWFFVYSIFVLVFFITLLCFINPKRLPFVLYSLSLFYFIRAAFTSLTHLAPFPTQISFDFGTLALKIFGGADLFFSGYTGVTFLMSLMFWHHKVIRYIFLGWSVLSGIMSLMGHLHYSIDIFAAFFITYGIYNIALYFFPKERELFLS